jgi:hypothetical protein
LKPIQAVSSGFEILSTISPSEQHLSGDTDQKPALDENTQLKLSDLLKVAYSAVSVESLVDEILLATTSLVLQLCLPVAQVLHSCARSREALALLDKQLANNDSQANLFPQLSRQKGLILQSLGSDIPGDVQAFEFAIARFSNQLGPLYHTTLSSRREYALFRAQIGDRTVASNILRDIKAVYTSRKARKKLQTKIMNACSREIKRLEAFKQSESSALANSYNGDFDGQESIKPSVKRKFSTSCADPGDDLRPWKQLYRCKSEEKVFCEE